MGMGKETSYSWEWKMMTRMRGSGWYILPPFSTKPGKSKNDVRIFGIPEMGERVIKRLKWGEILSIVYRKWSGSTPNYIHHFTIEKKYQENPFGCVSYQIEKLAMFQTENIPLWSFVLMKGLFKLIKRIHLQSRSLMLDAFFITAMAQHYTS